jgi:hypothetical protein
LEYVEVKKGKGRKRETSASLYQRKWGIDEQWLSHLEEPLFINWENKKDFFFSVVVFFVV